MKHLLDRNSSSAVHLGPPSVEWLLMLSRDPVGSARGTPSMQMMSSTSSVDGC